MTNKGTSLFTLILSIIFTGTLFLPPGHTSADQQITLVYAGASPSTGFTAVGMERWKKEVAQRTGGMVTISDMATPGHQLSNTAIVALLATGKADIACAGILPAEDQFLVPSALALPLDIPDARTGSAVFLSFYKQYQAQMFPDFKVLALFTSAPANLISTIRIQKPSDLRGLDLQASGVTAELLAAWHANPIDIPPAHRQEALQKGVVKGMLTSLEALKDADYATTCGFATLTNTMVYPFVVLMNQKKWNQLPDTAKQVMDTLVAEQSQWTGQYIDRYAKEAVEWAVRNHKTKISQLPKEQTKQLNRRLYGKTAKWVEKCKAEGIPADNMFADLKVLVERYRNTK